MTSDDRLLKVAVVSGNHPFNIPAFYQLFESMSGIKAYIQNLDEFTFSGHKSGSPESQAVFQENRRAYDVIVFYNFHKPTPEPAGQVTQWFERGRREVLESLGQTRQGIILLHHALIAFPDWPFWSSLIGIPDRSFKFAFDQKIRIEVSDPSHPINHGLVGWEMTDEVYDMACPDANSHILLSTQEPRSIATIAWTRTFGQSRVVCLQSGHDHQAYAHPSFIQFLHQSIRWAAREI